MSHTFTLAIVLVVAQQPTAPTPSASQAAAPLQARSRRATFLRSDEGFVTSMAFSPDGNTLAVGYARAPDTASGVVLWDVAGRKARGRKAPACDRGLRQQLGLQR